MLKYLYLTVAISLFTVFYISSKRDLPSIALWERIDNNADVHRIVLADNYWVESKFKQKTGAFISTFGGKWTHKEDSLLLDIHFNSEDSSIVGNTIAYNLKLIKKGSIEIDGKLFKAISESKQGALSGAWFINGRMREGELQSRPLSSRRTLKILSKSTFQWIAYNIETGQFRGSGGGLYETTTNGDYIENIEFFSRDSSRVGATLPFEFEIIDGIWHHKGLSSKGMPIYETWARIAD